MMDDNNFFHYYYHHYYYLFLLQYVSFFNFIFSTILLFYTQLIFKIANSSVWLRRLKLKATQFLLILFLNWASSIHRIFSFQLKSLFRMFIHFNLFKKSIEILIWQKNNKLSIWLDLVHTLFCGYLIDFEFFSNYFNHDYRSDF